MLNKNKYSFGLFNNWIIPNKILCGPFPGKDGINYISDDDVLTNLNEIINVGIRIFICLQEEIDFHNNTIDPNFTWAFPNFTNYTTYFDTLCTQHNIQLKCIQFPIKDCNIPTYKECDDYIGQIKQLILQDEKIFIHCAGGHGRTGIFSAILIGIYENANVDKALLKTQQRHDTRSIQDRRQSNVSLTNNFNKILSPSTNQQKLFVKDYFDYAQLHPTTSFTVTLNNKELCVSGGMSAEICFAKYYAFRTDNIYFGWDNNIRMANNEIILNTLNYVVDTVKKIEFKGCNKTVLYSPGFTSVPYIIELCNFVYLPSQFLVGCRRIKDIKSLLHHLHKSNIEAYAIIGYDGCIPNVLVAWIKFIKMPPQYNTLITEHLQSTNIIISGINPFPYLNNYKHKTLGENCIYKYNNNKDVNNNNCNQNIEHGDIYMLCIGACYGDNIQKDYNIFKTLCYDFNHNKMDTNKSSINDWESGIDIIKGFYDTDTISIYIMTSIDTIFLYNLATNLAKEFMNINDIKIKGVVANPYILSNPTYETNYGYEPFLFWQGNPNTFNTLNDMLINDKNIDKLWLNDYNNYNKNTLKLLDVCCDRAIKKIHINNNSTSICKELGNWIKRYRPKEYTNKTFITIDQLYQICKKNNIKFNKINNFTPIFTINKDVTFNLPANRDLYPDIHKDLKHAIGCMCCKCYFKCDLYLNCRCNRCTSMIPELQKLAKEQGLN